MTAEEIHELRKLGKDLAYNAILHSGLYRKLPASDRHSQLAIAWGEKLWRLAEGWCDEELTQIETQHG